MKRRTFLRQAAQTGLGAGLASGLTTVHSAAQTSDAQQLAGQTETARPIPVMGAEAMDAYFTDARMHAALGTEALRKPSDVKVIAFTFPSWHPTPFMEARFGKGWTEFDTLRNARRLFPGHTMPHYPLWGYYNEADPVWAAREIDLAADHGVDAWMIDWYWREGTQFYQEQIEQGLLKAENRNRLQFAIMWANHDWKNVYPARSPAEAAMILPQVHTQADFAHVADYCCEHYFSQSNYLRVDGAPLFAIFDVGKIIQQLGIDGLKQALLTMRERALRAGFPKLHLQVVGGYYHYLSRLGEFGFDSVTQYGTFGWTYGGKPAGSRIPYGVGAMEAVNPGGRCVTRYPYLSFHARRSAGMTAHGLRSTLRLLSGAHPTSLNGWCEQPAIPCRIDRSKDICMLQHGMSGPKTMCCCQIPTGATATWRRFNARRTIKDGVRRLSYAGPALACRRCLSHRSNPDYCSSLRAAASACCRSFCR
jgi:hypothetical protein